VRLLRVPATAEDAAWVREVPGAVLVLWPATFTDSVVADGVVAFEGGRVAPLVAPLARMMVAAGRPIARWRDGAPAATESVLGVGCSRSVGVGVPAAGDLVLRPPFEDFLAAMLAPCGGARAAPLPDSTLAWLASEGPLASGSALAATDVSSPLTKWLLLTALLVLMVEQLVRRRRVATEVPA
jgi:hypothetical protein